MTSHRPVTGFGWASGQEYAASSATLLPPWCTLPHLLSCTRDEHKSTLNIAAPSIRKLECSKTTKGTCQGQLDFWLAPCHQDLFCSAVEIGAGQNSVVPNFLSLFSLLFFLQDWICWHLWSCIVIIIYGLCHKLNKLNAQYCNVSQYWAWGRRLLTNNIKKKAKLIQSSKIHCPDRGTCPMPMPSPIKKVDQSDYCCQAEGILKDISIVCFTDETDKKETLQTEKNMPQIYKSFCLLPTLILWSTLEMTAVDDGHGISRLKPV